MAASVRPLNDLAVEFQHEPQDPVLLGHFPCIREINFLMLHQKLDL
jgi:hypothetical protein